MGIGYVVNNENEEIVQLLESINREQLADMTKKEMAIDAKELVEDYDALWHIIED